MKTATSAASLLLVLALIGLSVLACKHSGPEPAKLRLGFGSRSSPSKSFAPEEIAVSSIKITGSGPAGATVSAESADCLPVELELVPGAWTILAKGYSSKKVEVASGFIQIELSSSQSLSKEILLAPTVGDGSLSITWKLKGEAKASLRVKGSLKGSSDEIRAIDSAFSEGSLRFDGLRSGSWILELKLIDGEAELCGLADGLLIAAGMETKAALSFAPPEATLSLGFVIPDYSSLGFALRPSLRRAARGTSLVYRAGAAAPLSWYIDGSAISASGAEIAIDTSPGGLVGAATAGFRLDCLQTSALLPRSGSASGIICEAQALGRLRWGELLDKSVGSDEEKAAMRGLGDYGDLAWSADGSVLMAAGKSSDAVSIFEKPKPGSAFALGCLSGSAVPELDSPSLVRFLACGSILALSEKPGAAYAVARDSSALSLAAVLADPCLAGAKDLAVLGDGSAAYVAATDAEAISLLLLDASGKPSSARPLVKKAEGDLSAFSKPACIALSPDASLLAAGTTDDAIYLFDRGADLSLSFRAKVKPGKFVPTTLLSDPCSLAFSPSGNSLFVLSSSGDCVTRMDKDAGSGAFAPVAWARSGIGTVSGFATPRRLALSPDGSLLAVVGGGDSDGLALFDTSASGALGFVGVMLPGSGSAVPKKLYALCFSPDGSVLALVGEGKLSLFSISPR